DPDMSHAVLVLPAAAFFIWWKRPSVEAQALQPSLWGLALVAAGAIQHQVCKAPGWLFPMRAAFLISLAGCLVTLGGFPLVRKLALPLALLLFMFQPPRFLYDALTIPLQLVSSASAETLLEAGGVIAVREGNILEVAGHKLSVVEACSGIRSLFSLSFFTIVYGAFFSRGLIQTAVLLGSSIPVVIAANAMRIAATGFLVRTSPGLAEGFWHEVLGTGTMIAAFAGVLLIDLLLQITFRSRSAW
ncbi:MAG TPA: exosortase/archaeosortase family protein, partial [Bryobacteraceae bacterium]|nr:exosortase/archaeosortase family protein [Bryobacteraceae bacterium]